MQPEISVPGSQQSSIIQYYIAKGVLKEIFEGIVVEVSLFLTSKLHLKASASHINDLNPLKTITIHSEYTYYSKSRFPYLHYLYYSIDGVDNFLTFFINKVCLSF